MSFGTAGRNLGCKFCQNWDMSKSRQMDTLASQATPDMLAKACLQTHCRSIAYTYNDPIIFMEYAIDVAKACKEQNIYSVAVSAGFINPAPRIEFFKHMDAANIDLKGFNETFYRKICGGHLQPVLDTLQYLVNETNCWVEITNLIIPGKNDDPKELRAMCEWIREQFNPFVPLHFTAFHPDFKILDKPRTPLETLVMARNIALDCGLKHAYTGNVAEASSGSTYCSHCHQLLIERSHYQLGRWQLDESGCCNNCKTPLAGFFESAPGTWGPRRQPIQFK
ncbi:AmmeMemoRadiSam system radical SAM enzyme [Amphritea balenae]|uniref:AmmeMemoRadiSam system radical SAM enzyme n=1 Tax=Amphritea balenae TaxID=452629 RepID=UPI001E3DDB2D|nr:AmmeMemoRadiSam system radical SAM enzyme [Amphritea balenae]